MIALHHVLASHELLTDPAVGKYGLSGFMACLLDEGWVGVRDVAPRHRAPSQILSTLSFGGKGQITRPVSVEA
jgi:hypothetical protein